MFVFFKKINQEPASQALGLKPKAKLFDPLSVGHTFLMNSYLYYNYGIVNEIGVIPNYYDSRTIYFAVSE